MKRTKRQRLQEREEWLAVKVAQGHPCASVLKRWERDLKRTRAMLRAEYVECEAELMQAVQRAEAAEASAAALRKLIEDNVKDEATCNCFWCSAARRTLAEHSAGADMLAIVTAAKALTMSWRGEGDGRVSVPADHFDALRAAIDDNALLDAVSALDAVDGEVTE